MKIVFVDSTGEILKISSGDAESIALNKPEGSIEIDTIPDSYETWWNGSVWVQKPVKPSDSYEWDPVAKIWVDTRTLGEYKKEKWQGVKQLRSAEICNTVAVGSLVFDATPEAQTNILAAIQIAELIGPSWEAEWTLADNSTATVNREILIAAALAIAEQTAAAFAKARILREQIETATSIAEIATIL